MCENFVIVSSQGQALARYSLRSNEFCFPIHSPSIISGGDKAWVITSRSPDTLQSMEFGYTSEVSQKRMDRLNLRTEEVDRDDDEDEYDLSLIHISEPTRLGMISYAVFCLKKKKK